MNKNYKIKTQDIIIIFIFIIILVILIYFVYKKYNHRSAIGKFLWESNEYIRPDDVSISSGFTYGQIPHRSNENFQNPPSASCASEADCTKYKDSITCLKSIGINSFCCKWENNICLKN
jgi:hypothetical protein